MIGLFGNLKFLRATLAFTLLVASCQSVDAEILDSWKRESKSATPLAAAPRFQTDQKVTVAEFQEPTTENRRLLVPPTRNKIATPGETPADASSRTPAFAMPKIESFATAGSGLAIVVGLFLVCMWLLRRSGPKPTSPLPQEVVSVLGRVPLAARNFAHLIKIGNKLVLIAVTPDGVSPIAEVTDPAEVDRLLGLCLRNHKQSTTAEFHNVLEQLAKEPASGFLGNEVAGNEVAASYASQGRS